MFLFQSLEEFLHMALSNQLKIPIHEAILKNRYVDRTFIMTEDKIINKNIKRKLTVIDSLVKDKNILLVDDSIVRGNTSRHIINILKNSGVNKIYFCSAAPKIININQYGIYLPNKKDLIAYNKTHHELERKMECDKVIYNDLDEIIQLLRTFNPLIKSFEISMFLP